MSPTVRAELTELIELLIEERISITQFQRLEQLLANDSESRRHYTNYMDLHGSLYLSIHQSALPSADELQQQWHRRRRLRLYYWSGIAATAATFLIAALSIATNNPSRPNVVASIPNSNANTVEANNLYKNNRREPNEHVPIHLETQRRSNNDLVSSPINIGDVANEKYQPPRSTDPGELDMQHTDRHSDVVDAINAEFANSWSESGIKPSQDATDGEWLRRVFLDIAGRIPTSQELSEFHRATNQDKRRQVVEALLDSEDYIRHFSQTWSNLLIGRVSLPDLPSVELRRFLRNAFHSNRGWNLIVEDVITANGSPKDNGAASFLLAHTNNEAVPVTAITAKVFLCQQIQCAQCHDHPLNDFRQNEFWSLNAIFKEMRPVASTNKGEMSIQRTPHPGNVFYESRNGVLRVAFPEYDGIQLDPNSEQDLRTQLAKAMQRGESPQIARAFVNRLWQHFMGRAFTLQVDDMGPHSGISHPRVHDQLSRQFVLAGYDIKQLIRWITQSKPYNLSSTYSAANASDTPETGASPLFSRCYVKSMTGEQLFDSVLVATDARGVLGDTWEEVESNRSRWIQQFVCSFNTDENDESTYFDGTINQALAVMNSDLVRSTVFSTKAGYIGHSSGPKESPDGRIDAIALSALSRKATPSEQKFAKSLIKNYERTMGIEGRSVAIRDVMWAYLNSNEFILNH